MLFGSTKVRAQNDCPDIEWMRFFNNDNIVYCSICQVDSHYYEIVTGMYEGSFTFGTYNLPVPHHILNDYIAKIDSTGSPLWVNVAENFASSGMFFFSNPIVDSLGNIYTVLNFNWKMVFAGTTYTTSPSQQNALFIKMNPQGQVLATHLFEGLSIYLSHIDQNQNFYCSTNFVGTIDIDGHTYISNGEGDVCVFKLSPQFQLLWAQQIGGDKEEKLPLLNGNGICLKADSQSNIYIAGVFKSASLSLGSIVLNNSHPNGSMFETFMAKIGSNGNYIWVKSIPDPDFSLGAMAIDNSDNVYLTGSFTDTLNLGNTIISALPVNNYNSILIKYNHATDSFSSMAFRGGRNSGSSLLYLPQKNTMVLSGLYSNEMVDFHIDSLSASSTNWDFYVSGVNLSSNWAEQTMLPQWLIHSHGDGAEWALALVNDFEDNIYLSGSYSRGVSALGNYTFPAIPGNNSYALNAFHAKLSFLSREVTDSNGLLTAVQDNAIYQWLNCDNGLQPVAGATNQSFQPTQPGSYAVRVSNSFCSVVSECISSTGISETDKLRQIGVYPNPVQETLHLNHLPLGTQVSAFDVLGRAVYTATATNSNLNISTRLWSPGLYMLRLSKDGAVHLEKVVKE